MDTVSVEKSVWCTLRFTACHYWEDAKPPSVDYLKNAHRHEFHVKAGVKITRDRSVEFITLKNQIEAYIKHAYTDKTFTHSCEAIAEDILRTFKLSYVEVSEDGENGATVTCNTTQKGK
jgi:hypothetical protein